MIECVLLGDTEKCSFWFLARNPPKGIVSADFAEIISPLARASTDAIAVKLRVKTKGLWSARAEVHFSRKLTHSSHPLRVAARLQIGSNTPIIGAYPIPGRPSFHYITVNPATEDSLEYWRVQAEELSEGFISLINVVKEG